MVGGEYPDLVADGQSEAVGLGALDGDGAERPVPQAVALGGDAELLAPEGQPGLDVYARVIDALKAAPMCRSHCQRKGNGFHRRVTRGGSVGGPVWGPIRSASEEGPCAA